MVIGVLTIPRLDPATLRAGIVVALATGLYFFLFRWSIGSRLRPSVLPAKEIAIASCFTAGSAIAAAPRDLGDIPAVDLAGLACLILELPPHLPPRESARDAREDPAAFFADGKGTTPARWPLSPDSVSVPAAGGKSGSRRHRSP